MARKPKKGPGGPSQQQQKPQGGGGGGWAPLRDAIRRDVEQAVTALAFAERLHVRLETQRRLFHDFPRSTEQLRSGAMERVTAALSRLRRSHPMGIESASRTANRDVQSCT